MALTGVDRCLGIVSQCWLLSRRKQQEIKPNDRHRFFLPVPESVVCGFFSWSFSQSPLMVGIPWSITVLGVVNECVPFTKSFETKVKKVSGEPCQKSSDWR